MPDLIPTLIYRAHPLEVAVNGLRIQRAKPLHKLINSAPWLNSYKKVKVIRHKTHSDDCDLAPLGKQSQKPQKNVIHARIEKESHSECTTIENVVALPWVGDSCAGWHMASFKAVDK